MGAVFGTVSPAALMHYILAHPGQAGLAGAWSGQIAHHLHCAMHSVVVAGAVSGLLGHRWPALRWPLAGWWLHIAIDIPTHANDYFPVPVLYPFSYRGFDGIAWTSPRFLAVNYALLAAAGAWLLATRPRRGRPGGA